MKKIILIILIILIIPLNPAFASKISESLSAVENNIFGYDYVNDSDTKRVERLEEQLYGEKKTGVLSKRIENIKNDIGYTNPALQMNEKPEMNEKITQQQEEKKEKDAAAMALKEDASVDYPMVDRIEEEIFHTTYKKENIYTRLNRLEEKVFNKTSNDDLNTRVDRLASVAAPQRRKTHNQENYYSEKDLNSYYSNSGLEAINDQSMPFQLAALEEELFKSSYMQDNNSNRLTRLEQKLFKRNFPNDSDITRLQRVMVAYDAKRNSYKYENNRKMQNMATASQIGGILLMILAILL